jgi:large subunit ribosomal protein L4
MVRGALRSALSDRVKANRVLVVDEFKLESAKTKILELLLKQKLQVEQVLIVDSLNRNLELSGRNLPRVKVLRTEGLNVYDVIRNDWVVLTKRAVQAVESRLAPTS